MQIPVGFVEQDVLAAIDDVAEVIGRRFAFACFDEDDVAQMVRLWCLELLAKNTYDPSRPLRNYFYVNARCRALNLRRDRLRRIEGPCAKCQTADRDGTLAYCKGDAPCDAHVRYVQRNAAKESLMRPKTLDKVPLREEAVESTVQVEVEVHDLGALIDRELPLELRLDFVKMRDGVTIPKVRRKIIQRAIKTILTEAGLGDLVPPEDDGPEAQFEQEGAQSVPDSCESSAA